MKTKRFWEAFGRADALYGQYAAAHGLNVYQLNVLYCLYGAEGQTQSEIASRTGLSRQTVSTVIRALLQKRFVTLSPAPGDRREKLVCFTMDGRDWAGDTLAPLHAIEDAVYRALGAAQAASLQELLDRFETLFSRECRQED